MQNPLRREEGARKWKLEEAPFKSTVCKCFALELRQPSAQNDLEATAWAPALAAAPGPDWIQPTTSPWSLKDLTAHGLCPAVSPRRHWDCFAGSTGWKTCTRSCEGPSFRVCAYCLCLPPWSTISGLAVTTLGIFYAYLF